MAGEASKPLSADVLWGGSHRSPFSASYGKIMMWIFLASDALTFTGFLAAFGFARHSLAPGVEWPIGDVVFRSMPFLEGSYPLMYVALMTFLLIISSVTMVLAVEAGHRMDKKGVIKWMFLTVIGGFFFLGSQAWEWKHFIHGSGGVITTPAGERWHVHTKDHLTVDPNLDASFSLQKKDRFGELLTEVKGDEAQRMWSEKLTYVHGANMTENEYGPPQYAQFFFFITGFHGFHVSIGVLINLIVFFQVLKGVYHRRGHYEMVEKAGLYWHFVDLVWVFVFTFFYLI